MTGADLARMAWQHLTSLQTGGVEWLAGTQNSTKIPSSRQARPAEVRPAEKMSLSSTHSENSLSVPTELHSTEYKRQQLQLMDQNEVQSCVRCTELVRNRTRTVFGVGNVDTELLFVGEAPGADEDKAGEPFVGAAGQLLNKIITACKLNREEIYIANVLKCRPPGNRQPVADEVANCRGYLDRQIKLIQPRFICCLGLVAAQTILNTTTSIGKLRKQIHQVDGIKVVATYHPAYLLRNPNAKKDVWDDMKMLMSAMGRPVT